MSTAPPEGGPPPQQQQPGYMGMGRTPVSGAILPVPGNAELVIWFIVVVILAIVAAIADDFDAHGWAVATTWITAAYILSRGIAKASRVLEQ
ncbi:MAG TPA: hypothetical protein VGK79_07825 [Gaiellaceae bacterium]|jgi:hypothetical protein